MTIYAQRDPRWANLKLGNSQSSFGDYGCLLCCFASMANDCDKTVTPPQLNELLKEKNLYVEGDLLNDWVIENVYPDIKFLETKYYGDVYADLGYIREKLSEGKLLIAGIDFYPLTDYPDYHFVRIISSDDNGFKIMDPWYAEANQYISKYYGSAGRAILKVMVYQYTASENVLYNKQKLAELLETEKKYQEFVSNGFLTFQSVRDSIEGYQSRITTLEGQKASAQAELKNRIDQVSRLKQQLLDEEKLHADDALALANINKTLDELRDSYEGRIKTMQTQIDGLAKEKGTLNIKIGELETKIKTLQGTEEEMGIVKKFITWFKSIWNK